VRPERGGPQRTGACERIPAGRSPLPGRDAAASCECVHEMRRVPSSGGRAGLRALLLAPFLAFVLGAAALPAAAQPAGALLPGTPATVLPGETPDPTPSDDESTPAPDGDGTDGTGDPEDQGGAPAEPAPAEGATGTGTPTVAASPVDVYTTPGYHTVNGRQWRTTCGKYSSTIDRCRTEILASTVVGTPGRYRVARDWVFNNLTYLPAPRSAWAGNPLATTGTFTSNGRQWRTECDTPATGVGACRSYILASVVSAVPRSGGGYSFVTRRTWVFNNLVRFTDKTPPPPLCEGAPLPTGYALAGRRPHVVKTPYTPNTLYNPTSISNFIRAALRDTRTTTAQKHCLAELGGEALIAGSRTTTTASGATARWFPYMFEFSANLSVPSLAPGWVSGLAQGGAIGALLRLAEATGDERWADYAAEVFETYTVPIEEGGFVNRADGVLWFEEYPTSPPTTVLNGHLEAVVALDLWQRHSHDPRATALFQEAVADLPTVLAREHVPVTQGIVSSYDMMRGWTAAPLRVASGSPLVVHSAAVLDGEARRPLTLPTNPPARDGANLLVNSGFDSWTGTVPTGWQMQIGHSKNLSSTGGALWIRTTGTGWQAVSQTVPASRLVAGTAYRVSWRGKVVIPEGAVGTSGRVVGVAYCPSGAVNLGDSAITRGRTFSQFDLLLKPVPAGCSLRVTLYQASSTVAGTQVVFDDVTLTPAQPLGSAVVPTYPLSVLRSPQAQVELTYTGTGELQAYENGRWHKVAHLSAAATPRTVTVTVPERFTGRNLHYGYHETHIDELVSLYRRTGEEVFLETARLWAPLAPAKGPVFANLGLDVYTPPVDGLSAPPEEPAPSLEEQDAARLAPRGGPGADATPPDIGATPPPAQDG